MGQGRTLYQAMLVADYGNYLSFLQKLTEHLLLLLTALPFSIFIKNKQEIDAGQDLLHNYRARILFAEITAILGY